MYYYDIRYKTVGLIYFLYQRLFTLHNWPTLHRQNAENLKQIFPEKEYRGLIPNFHIHVSVSELYIYSHDESACSAGGNM